MAEEWRGRKGAELSPEHERDGFPKYGLCDPQVDFVKDGSRMPT
jgi:hypothetical protein